MLKKGRTGVAKVDLKTLTETPPWDWPSDAGTLFLNTLNDRTAKESDRLIAAELAGNCVVINDDLAVALLAVICHAGETETLRARAAISLGAVLEQADTDGFEDPDEVPISERTFRKIQDTLRRAYLDQSNPKEVRRRTLEASVRAPMEWHQAAVKAAYFWEDKDWKLTAVFCMRWIRGFDDLILESLESADPLIQYEAVNAAGSWQIDQAWPRVVELLARVDISKALLLAAISAASSIRPTEARESLTSLVDSEDEEIAEAAEEAIAISEPDFDDDENDAGEWIN